VHEVRRVVMESPGGHAVTASRDTPLYLTMRRTELDAALLARARAAGARVRESARVVEIERPRGSALVRCVGGTEERARIVIGADGVNSVVARAAGLTAGFPDEALAIDTMEETPLAELSMADPGSMDVAHGYKGGPGSASVSPRADCVDFGVGYMLPFYKRALSGPPYPHHARFLDEVV